MKDIIFVGRSGSGKSTIATMLYQKKLKAFDNSFEINDTSKGVTIKYSVEKTNDWAIYDTVGLGESKNGAVPNSEAIKQISDFFVYLNINFHYICIVIKKRRLDKCDDDIVKIIKSCFRFMKDNIVLIVTHADGKWLAKNRVELEKEYGHIPMIAVDFPPVDEDDNKQENYNVKKRNKCLKELIEWLLSLNNQPIDMKNILTRELDDAFCGVVFYKRGECFEDNSFEFKYINISRTHILVIKYQDENNRGSLESTLVKWGVYSKGGFYGIRVKYMASYQQSCKITKINSLYLITLPKQQKDLPRFLEFERKYV